MGNSVCNRKGDLNRVGLWREALRTEPSKRGKRVLMKSLTLKTSGGLALGIGLFSLVHNVEGATTFSDLTTGGHTTINQAIFATDVFQSSGTGVIDPFIRLQSAGNNTYE